ncbi:MAG: hypothetical protein HY900_16760 [Deltaproteobacteria bacterium]|nr:hypothetical protein [Deltaproteobacteria bacterium]
MCAWERWKPAAAARTHLLLGGLLWMCVGAGLSVAGTRWALQTGAAASAVLLAVGVALGLLKGKLVLERTARRSSERILRRGDGKCLGGFLSWQSWLFVVGMMALGAALRHSPVPRTLVAVVYVAVGVALLSASRVFWSARRST